MISAAEGTRVGGRGTGVEGRGIGGWASGDVDRGSWVGDRWAGVGDRRSEISMLDGLELWRGLQPPPERLVCVYICVCVQKYLNNYK